MSVLVFLEDDFLVFDSLVSLRRYRLVGDFELDVGTSERRDDERRAELVSSFSGDAFLVIGFFRGPISF